MNYKRWYDKEKNLRTIVESLRTLDYGSRHAFALDIIQSVVGKQSDTDTFLEVLNNDAPINGKRWYDDKDVFQSAVEMLKYLSIDEIEELFTDTLISMMYENENPPR